MLERLGLNSTQFWHTSDDQMPESSLPLEVHGNTDYPLINGPFQTGRSTVSSQWLLLDLRGFQALYLDFVGFYLRKIILRLLN